MLKRKILVLLLVLVLAAASALVMHNKSSSRAREEPVSESAENLKADSTAGQNAADSVEDSAENSTKDSEESRESAAENVIKTVVSDEIKVLNNTPEYDLKVCLCRNNLNDMSIKFEFYKDGASVVKELGSEQVPELKGLSSFNAAEGQKDGHGIEAVYLNPLLAKAYFAVKVSASSEFIEMSVYSFKLQDSSLKKIFSAAGRFTGLFFTRNQKYMGFSYYDLPSSGAFQENSLLEVINCENDMPVITGSRNVKGQLIGGEKDPNLIYDYSFIGWHSNNTAKIRESVLPKSGNKKAGKQRELLYDVEKNVFLNADGTPLADYKDGKKPGASQDKAESESIKTLKSFYACLSSIEQYNKAMALLDESFKLQLDILKQFGVDELSKKDIDAENVSMYASLLRMASFESIVREEIKDDTSTIYYYQLFSSGESEQTKQPMVAQLRKVDGKWKITCIKDGNK